LGREEPDEDFTFQGKKGVPKRKGNEASGSKGGKESPSSRKMSQSQKSGKWRRIQEGEKGSEGKRGGKDQPARFRKNDPVAAFSSPKEKVQACPKGRGDALEKKRI